MRLKLTIAYDGAAFRGWQSQAGGGSVQDALAAAARAVSGGPVAFAGSGRTDAGVHALAQVAHADVPDGVLAPRDWLRALNARLEPTVRVLRCARAPGNFHARYAARGKIYDYLLWTGGVLPPHWHGRAWHVRHRLDIGRLRAAAAELEGRHDFRGFSANRGTPVHDAVRELRRVRVTQRGPLVRLRFEGEGFLYKMARMLTAWLVRTACGRDEGPARAYFSGRRYGHVAPAHGLYLVRVIYGKAITD